MQKCLSVEIHICVFCVDHDQVAGLRKHVTAQEKRNVELTNSNTTLRKQVVEFGRVDVEQKEKISSLEKELATSLAA